MKGSKNMGNTMRLACAYCRVSSDHEEQKNSIREQKQQWLEFFSDTGSKNAEVGMICHRLIIGTKSNGTLKKSKLIAEPRTDGLYIDEGITGTSVRNRRAFQQMIEDAKQKKFDVIYVEDVSRFSRSVEDGLTVVKDLRELGVAVYFRKEGWDTLDTSKEFELQLRMSIAQEESRAKQDRIKWAINRLQQKGGWNSTAPYGYNRAGAFLEVNTSQAEIVQLIFDCYVNRHWGTCKICRYLNDNGIPTQKDEKWSQTQISSILRNRIYTGEQRTHTVESYDLTRHTVKTIPESEHIVHYKEELRIISDDLFNMANIEYARRREAYSKGVGVSNRHLLSTMLYCNYCGGTFKRKKRHTYLRKDGTSKDIGYEWTCGLTDMYGSTAKSKGGKCSGGRNALIEDDVIQAIKYEIACLKKSDPKSLFDAYMEGKFKDIEQTDKNALQLKLEMLNNEMRQLRQDKVEGLISEDVYSDSMKELNTEIADIKAGISRIDRIEIEKNHHVALFNDYVQAIKDINLDAINEFDDREQTEKANALLKNIFHKILVKYRIDEEGKKKPYLHYVYRFLDTTDEAILSDEKDGTIIDWVYLYTYKTDKEYNSEAYKK